MRTSMQPWAHPLALSLALTAATLLAACSDSPVSDDLANGVPASATASPEAFTRYVAALPEDEQREPLNVEGLTPPTTETAEPEAVTR